MRHYCSSCKRHVPLAPGTRVDERFTVGVAHAWSREPFSQWSFPCTSAFVRRTYSPDEQERNLDEIDFWSGRCSNCGGTGRHIRDSGTPYSMEELCPACDGSGHL